MKGEFWLYKANLLDQANPIRGVSNVLILTRNWCKLNFRASDLTKSGATTPNSSGPQNPRPSRFATERPSPTQKTTVATHILFDYLEEWLFECEYQQQAKKTIGGKRSAVELFLWWLKRQEIEVIGLSEVKQYLHYVKTSHESKYGRFDEALECKYRDRYNRVHAEVQNPTRKPDERAFKPISDRAVQLYWVYIKNFFDYLASPGIEIIPRSPLDGAKQPRAKQPKIVRPDMADIAAMEKAAPKIRGSKRSVALILFLLDTGLRADELCQLNLQDVDFKRGVAHVHKGKGDKARDVCFESDARSALIAYLKDSPCEQNEPLFRSLTTGGRLRPESITKSLKKLGAKAGVQGKRCSAHDFRHVFASEWAASNASPKGLQLQMGHETEAMALRYYIQFSEEQVKEAHRRASPARRLREFRK